MVGFSNDPAHEASSNNGTNQDDSYEESNNGNNYSATRPFISRHRKVLDRISADSTKSSRHSIPTLKNENGDGSDSPKVHSNNKSYDHDSDHGGDYDGGKAPVWKSAYHRVQQQIVKVAAEKRESIRKNTKRDAAWARFLYTFLPCYSWLQHYNVRTTLLQDVIAGLTVGAMVIPQSMSYAKLAGLPVEYGLYSAFFPIYAYALFGSSRQLAVGPVAVLSLLLNSSLVKLLDQEGLSETDEEYMPRYLQLTIQASWLVGLTYIGMGLLKLGFVTIFLSRNVISGFTTGAAITIGLSQLKYILGYNIPRSDKIVTILKNTFRPIRHFDYKPFVMGTFAIALLLLMKNISRKYPSLKVLRPLGPLTVTIIGIILSYAADLESHGFAVVGNIPSGFPNITVKDWLPIHDFGRVYVMALSLVIVGFMESISIAKSLAARHKYEIDSSSELLGLGMANFAGSIFQAYPVTGSFSRSAVNNDSGAKSGLSGVITATLVMIALLLLTPLFEKVPMCILGAIVISAVISLLDFEEAARLYHVHIFDFCVWMAAFLGVIFFGVEIGLGISVGVSLLLVIYESAYPHTAVLGRLPGTTHYRSVKQYPDAETYDGIVIVRIDAPLYFANALNVREKIRKYRLAAEEDAFERRADHKSSEEIVYPSDNHLTPYDLNKNGDQYVHFIILDCAAVAHIDTTAIHELENMNANHLSRNQQIIFSNPNKKVMERLESCGLIDKVGREFFFPSLHDAVQYSLQEMDNKAKNLYNLSQHGSQLDEYERKALDNGNGSDESVVKDV